MDDYFYLKIGMLVFNINILIVGLLFYIQWSYAVRHKLIDERLTPEHKQYGYIKNSITWIVALCALIVGLFNTNLASYLYLIIPIAIIVLNKNKKYSDI
jgi:uncharacterized membrane protein YiaA